MHVVLVGRDIAYSSCFRKVAAALVSQGVKATLFVGDGKQLTVSLAEVASEVACANVVLLGMSSSKVLAEPEIVAGTTAKSLEIPYGFYGDVPRCWARARKGAWFEPLAGATSFYFGVTETDTEAAREVFPNAELIMTGNPLREEMAYPELDRETVRMRLGATPDEKIIFAPGGKSVSGNIATWALVIDALTRLKDKGFLCRLIISIHPGDRIPSGTDPVTGKNLGIYEELKGLSTIPFQIIPRDILTSSNLVTGSDLIIEFGSSIGIEGAYQNVPVITLGLEILLRRNEEIYGIRTPEAVREGVSELVQPNVESLTGAIARLLTPDGFAQLRASQEKTCPKPQVRGYAIKTIVESLIKITK